MNVMNITNVTRDDGTVPQEEEAMPACTGLNHVLFSEESDDREWLDAQSLAAATIDCSLPQSTDHIPLRAGARCVKGGYRTANEDKCLSDTWHGVFLVADGMGGHFGGAEASRILLETLPDLVQAAIPEGSDAERLETLMQRALAETSARMVAYAAEHPRCRDMGATMALVIVRGDVAYATHVGDCRVYHARGESLRLLTSDQTFAQELVEAGVLSPAEAEQNPHRHRVTNWVGAIQAGGRPSFQAVQLQPEDRLLLATDGLAVLGADTVGHILRAGDPQDAADALIIEALRNDTRDNVTCVVVKALHAS